MPSLYGKSLEPEIKASMQMYGYKHPRGATS